MENNKKTMGIYCRVASPIQPEKAISLEMQKKKGIEKAKQLGFEYKLFVEDELSASMDNLNSLSILHELLTACAKEEVSCVFCTDLYRLSRSLIALEHIKAIFVKHNIILHTMESVVDLNDREQEFIAYLLPLLSARESNLKSARSRRGVEIAARNGKWIGAVLPYGYRRNENRVMVVDEEAAAVVRKLYRECINGKGTLSIAQGFNQDEVTKQELKPKGSVLTPGKVYSILTNPIYKGERRYKGSLRCANT